jgi:hypothetical protein
MSPPIWAFVVDRASLRAIARLRQQSGIEVCEQRDVIWLRGSALDPALEKLLKLIPGGQSYRVLASGQLVASGKLVPSGELPTGAWQPLAEWLRLDVPLKRPAD